jgi:hypothetical protein
MPTANETTTIIAYGKRYGVSDLGLHARTPPGGWRLVRVFHDAAALERLRKACKLMLSQQASQVLGGLDPSQHVSPVDTAEQWGWEAVQRVLDAERVADEIPW